MAIRDQIRIRRSNSKDPSTYYPVLIIGAGESGIAMGCKLKDKLGFDQFRIFERQSSIGGTWWINQYPGVACDIPSALYSYSFAPYYTSKQLFPTGSEFLDYLHRVTEKFGIVDKIQTNTDVSNLCYLEDVQEWEITLSHLVPGLGDLSSNQRNELISSHGRRHVYTHDETVRAKIVVSCVGILVEPKMELHKVPGFKGFKGDILHSARWQSNVDLAKKDVVVVGSGCSAAQIVPSLLTDSFQVKSMTQVMRTPPWVCPRLEEPFGKELWARYAPIIFRWFPFLGYFLRSFLFLTLEMIWYAVSKTDNTKWRAHIEADTLRYMRSKVPQNYHSVMTPNYSYGCKRRIFDSAWCESMSDPRYRLTTHTIKEIKANGVILGNRERGTTNTSSEARDSCEDNMYVQADALILASGFEATQWLHPLIVRGRNGVLIHDVWNERGGPQAYMGTAMDNFPNFFMILGPNTASGHTSFIIESENISNYILKVAHPVLRGEATSVEPKKEAAIRWTSGIHRDIKKTIFTDCSSWYQESGWNSTMYPRSQIDFTIRCMLPKYSDWDYSYTTVGHIKQIVRRVALYSLSVAAVASMVYLRMTGQSLVGLVRSTQSTILGVAKQSMEQWHTSL